MFEEFSNSYYIGRMFVTRGDDYAAIQQSQLEELNDTYFVDDEPIARLDQPVVMKLGPHHFPVLGDEGIPEDTLALPDDLLEEAAVTNPPSLEGVLLAKADRASQLLKLTGLSSRDVGI